MSPAADRLEARLEEILTPALLIRLDRVRANIERMRELLGSDLDRWRPHVKTVKVPAAMAALYAAGVRAFKCATTREARVLLETVPGPVDLLVALAHRGRNLEAIARLARRHPGHRLSLLVEDPVHAAEARRIGPELGLFVDLDPPGFGRSGVPLDDHPRIEATVAAAGPALCGLHYYEGHVRQPDPAARAETATTLLDRFLAVADAVQSGSDHDLELVTSGTPTFLAALAHPGMRARRHRVSPGTVVYWDGLSEDLGIDGFSPAAVVLTRVTSAPASGRITCDAGAKAVDAAGAPCVRVEGRPKLVAGVPSDEHLPMVAEGGGPPPPPGSLLRLVPRHVCPTVNLHEVAVLLDGDRVVGTDAVAARAHDVL